MNELIDFLLARIAYDEAEANDADGAPTPIGMWDDERVLAECEAKRRIVTLYASDDIDRDEKRALGWALRAIGLPYADHPDFRDEWLS